MYTALLKKSYGEEKRKKPSTIHRYRQSSLSSQSDPLHIRRVHVHSNTIWLSSLATLHSTIWFFTGPHHPRARTLIAAAANAPGAATRWSGYPWNDRTPPAARRPIAAANYAREECKDRSPDDTKRKGHDERTTTQDGKGDNIGKTKESKKPENPQNNKTGIRRAPTPTEFPLNSP